MILEARNLDIRFGPVRAVADVSFTLPDGPFGLGLVGESGSGKTTIGRALARLVPLTSGSIEINGRDVYRLRREDVRAYRRTVQIVFQDPDATLDPRMRVGAALGEVLKVHRIVTKDEIPTRIVSLLSEVGLEPDHARAFPHQLSGGQRQRVSIARALAVEPRVLVFDEPTSALDVTVQARILTLIERLRAERRLSYLLISHNLAVIEKLCQQTLVLYLGRIVEVGPTREVLARPAHPYTQALRSAVPEIDIAARRRRLVLPGVLPDPADPPPGCPFHPRCRLAVEHCRVELPLPREIAPGHWAACHRAEEALADFASSSETGHAPVQSP